MKSIMIFNIESIMTCGLVAFFFVGGAVNGVAPKKVQDEYARWGYPGWFHYVTAASELLAALLLIVPATRVLGAILGIAVMTGAVATVLRHREYAHAVPPSIVLLLTAACGWLALNVA
ncbi:DoxX family protein [Burkholderia sp. IMCC1007]|uniref:DoxX family protein n=1 Tax=Burkholderia sp. IMCC1007 TaxID=3004104 RepID=UPI0022B2FAA7|nr:DoxX family protein [Burkholderia sp. IMCC1007]